MIDAGTFYVVVVGRMYARAITPQTSAPPASAVKFRAARAPLPAPARRSLYPIFFYTFRSLPGRRDCFASPRNLRTRRHARPSLAHARHNPVA